MLSHLGSASRNDEEVPPTVLTSHGMSPRLGRSEVQRGPTTGRWWQCRVRIHHALAWGDVAP